MKRDECGRRQDGCTVLVFSPPADVPDLLAEAARELAERVRVCRDGRAFAEALAERDRLAPALAEIDAEMERLNARRQQLRAAPPPLSEFRAQLADLDTAYRRLQDRRNALAGELEIVEHCRQSARAALAQSFQDDERAQRIALKKEFRKQTDALLDDIARALGDLPDRLATVLAAEHALFRRELPLGMGGAPPFSPAFLDTLFSE